MNRRIAVRGIVYKDGKLFLVRQKSSTGEVNPYWSAIGGGMDPQEPVLDAVKREFIEEMGVTPVVGNLLYMQQFSMEYKGELMEFLELFFHIKNTDDFHEIDLTKTSHGVEEIEEFEYVDQKNAYILPEFLTKTDIAADIASGKTQIFNYL